MPFKKGQSGNPKGRPPEADSIATEMRKILNEKAVGKDGKELSLTHKEVFARSVLKSALEGNARAAQLLWNHVDGMPTQKNIVDLGDKPILVLDGSPKPKTKSKKRSN